MSLPPSSIWIGFDPRESDGFSVTRSSIRRRLNTPIPIRGLVLSELQARGLYTRPTQITYPDNKLHMVDAISGAPMATEFAVSRFLVPFLAREMFGKNLPSFAKIGLAVFMDSDMLVRVDMGKLFKHIRERTITEGQKALWCVKHNHEPKEAVKMDAQTQTLYKRKNWSSMMVFDCDHPANAALTLEIINGVPGRDLHRFCWLDDSEIGELDYGWNFLVGYNEPHLDPSIIHFTEGLPSIRGYHNQPFAGDWRAELAAWAR
jgi:hypothetical protein